MELREHVRNDNITELALLGRLDVVGLQEVETRFIAFTAGARRNTILDLAGLEFIASLGIGMLLSSAKTLSQHGATMVLAAPRPDVDAVLRMTGIENAIPIVASIADAEALLAGKG